MTICGWWGSWRSLDVMLLFGFVVRRDLRLVEGVSCCWCCQGECRFLKVVDLSCFSFSDRFLHVVTWHCDVRAGLLLISYSLIILSSLKWLCRKNHCSVKDDSQVHLGHERAFSPSCRPCPYKASLLLMEFEYRLEWLALDYCFDERLGSQHTILRA